MIKLVAFALFTLSTLHSKPVKTVQNDEVVVGTVLQIGEPVSPHYSHIHFPKANFIIKSGGLADFKNLEGNLVVVTEIREKENGETEITFKRKNGQKFFRNYETVRANLSKALESGELRIN